MATLEIKYNDKIKTVEHGDFVKAAQKMLDEFGLKSDKAGINEQIDKGYF